MNTNKLHLENLALSFLVIVHALAGVNMKKGQKGRSLWY